MNVRVWIFMRTVLHGLIDLQFPPLLRFVALVEVTAMVAATDVCTLPPSDGDKTIKPV